MDNAKLISLYIIRCRSGVMLNEAKETAFADVLTPGKYRSNTTLLRAGEWAKNSKRCWTWLRDEWVNIKRGSSCLEFS